MSKIVTIQQTGKGLKLSLILSAVCLAAGIVMLLESVGTGITLIAVALVWRWITNFLIWWRYR